MTKRPDYADQPGGEAARMAQGRHEACVCGDRSPCCCGTPSPGWFPPCWWPSTHRDWRLVLNAIQASDRALSRKLDNLLKEIKKMGEATAAALAELNKDLHRLADGYTALQAENQALKDALASADADKAQAVADAIAADDAVDSAAIAEADAIVEGLSPEPAPVEEPPADSGGDVPPTDGGDVPPAA